jgi:hypothetical protein
MMRTTARLMLVAITVVGLLLVLNTGPRKTIQAQATQPDLYSVTASSAAIDTRSIQSGSPVDPAPVANTAMPLASVSADNSPTTNVHAAYVEPPGSAEAATGLDNVPVPYVTKVDALCVACAKPVVHDADGQLSQDIDGGRVSLSDGRAHAAADQYDGIAQASNGRQSVGPLDQVTQLYDALVYDAYKQLNSPPPSPIPQGPPPPPAPCVAAPAIGPAMGGTVCTSTLPEVGVLAEAGASYARTEVSTSAQGTITDTTANLQDVQLLDGLISIGTLATTVHAAGDGTAARTTIAADTDIEKVCVAGDCSYSITAQGICKQGAAVCSEDPVNDMLRTEGFNLCRLGTGSSQSGTAVTGSAAGVLLEWHAMAVKGSYAVDPDYYKTYSGPCDTAAASPHQGFYGISSYVILGESAAQEQTNLFPVCLTCSTLIPTTGLTIPGQPEVPPVPGSSSTTITNTVAVPGASTPGGLRTVGVAEPGGVAGLKDRRGLLLAVFGLLELIMLCNLTAMALSRRSAS